MIYYCASQAPIFRNYAHAGLKEFINKVLRKRAEINRAKATPLRWPVFRIRGNETPFRITETISGPGGIYKKDCFYNKIYCKTYICLASPITYYNNDILLRVAGAEF